MSLDGRDLAVQYLTVTRSVETGVRMQFAQSLLNLGVNCASFFLSGKSGLLYTQRILNDI